MFYSDLMFRMFSDGAEHWTCVIVPSASSNRDAERLEESQKVTSHTLWVMPCRTGCHTNPDVNQDVTSDYSKHSRNQCDRPQYWRHLGECYALATVMFCFDRLFKIRKSSLHASM